MSLSCRGSAPAGAFDVFPDHLPTSRALFLEPPAAPCEILDQVSIPPGERIAVLGDGKLDLLIAMVLNAHGYRVHQFGRHAAKLAIAARAGVVTQMATEMATQIANGALPIAAYDWVVDATGSPEGLRSAAMTRPRGTVILKSTVHGTVAVSCEGDRPRRIDRERHAPGARDR